MNLAGSYSFYKACKKAKIKPILGEEIYYTVLDRTAREKDSDDENYYHLILLAQDKVGFKNLMKISSKSFSEGFYSKPRCDDALLAEYSEGIAATSACLGSRASQLLLKGRADEAESIIKHHSEIFKDRFFVELQLHEGEQQEVNQGLIKIAKKLNLPMIVTQDCHYLLEEDKLIHEQALCMQTGKTMNDENRFSFGDIDVHFANEDYMQRGVAYYKLPAECITNTKFFADSVKANYFEDNYNRYPKFLDLPPDEDSYSHLEYLCKSNLVKKMGGMPPQNYRDRINSELNVIKKMGFCDYLLIVQDFISTARDNNIYVGPGRGSAAGSLVAYALGITQFDPIKYNLLFERWLNYGRAAQPLIFTQEMKDKINAN